MVDKVRENLLQAQTITRVTGALTDLQVHQLKLWPHVVFSPDESSIEVDTEGHVVVYVLRRHELEEVDKRGRELAGWVKELLGTEWGIVIRHKQKKGGRGRVVFKSEGVGRTETTDVRVRSDVAAYPINEARTDFKRYKLRHLEAARRAASQILPDISDIVGHAK